MNNEHEIDQLLKESFDSFSPEAPDVWQAVQQGVQAAQVAGTASSGVAGAAVQGVGLVTKIVAGVAIAAASVTGYIVLRNQPVPEKIPATNTEIAQPALTEQHTQPEITTAAPEMSVESDEPVAYTEKKKVAAPKQSASDHKIITQPAEKTQQEITRPNAEVISQPELKKENNGIVVPAGEQHQDVQDIKTQATANGNDAVKAGVTKKDTAPKLPYNPNAEEGETYEKPVIGNAFTPNNDGLNDKFEIGIENETSFMLRVWNDKGELVFESRSKSQVWDGRHYKTGLPCPVGTYIYLLNYQYKGSDKPHEKGGTVGLYL